MANIQNAYGRQDRSALRALTTREMFDYFDDELTSNAAKGVVNRIAGVKLLQGDLSEAWGRRPAPSTRPSPCATRSTTRSSRPPSGRLVSNGESEVTELWTFRRNPGANAMSWKLSAIQQT